jgi:hypothetical protein
MVQDSTEGNLIERKGWVDLTAMGRVGMSGVRGKLAARLAEPVSENTSLTKEQVEAIFGAIFLALTFWQFFKLVRRVWKAGQGQELSVPSAV